MNLTLPTAILLALALATAPTAAQRSKDTPPPFDFTQRYTAGPHAFVVDLGRIPVPVCRGSETEGEPEDEAQRGAGEAETEEGVAPDTIRVAVARMRSTAAEPGPPVVFLADLPAFASALRKDAAIAPFWSELLAIGDVLLLDLRGSGGGRPRLDWRTDEEWKPWLLYTDRETAYEHLLGAAAVVREKRAAGGLDLGDFDPIEAADDVETVRQAIGYETVHVIGHGAGALIALLAAQRHPETVRRFVGLATVGPDDMIRTPAECDAALRRVAELVKTDPRIGEAMPDLVQRLRGVLANLEEEPLPVQIQHPRDRQEIVVPLGRFGLELLVLQDLGDERDLAVLPRLVHTLEERDPAMVRFFLQKRVLQLYALPTAYFIQRAAAGASPERWQRIAREAPEGVFGRTPAHFSPEVGAALGVGELGADFRRLQTVAVPALLVSGTLDAYAPPEQAERLRKAFESSTHVVLEGRGHDSLHLDPEVRALVLAFLTGQEVADARLPGPPLRFALLEGEDPEVEHPALEVQAAAD
jgi:pimeloyl-ACP methyl ester carboxylesterase